LQRHGHEQGQEDETRTHDDESAGTGHRSILLSVNSNQTRPDHFADGDEIAGADGSLIDGPLIDGELIEGELIDGSLIEGELIEGPLIDGSLIEGPLIDGELIEGPLIDGELIEGALGACIAGAGADGATGAWAGGELSEPPGPEWLSPGGGGGAPGPPG
jgi:hypothetical protein